MSLYLLAQQGDPDALSCLIRKHIPLVQALSKRFSYCEDAFQQGCLGLLLAIRGFQESLGYCFSTYAVPVILGEMRRAFTKSLGWRARRTLNKAKAYQDEIIKATGKEPSIKEMAQAAGTAPQDLILLLERDQEILLQESDQLLLSFPDPHSDSWLIRFFIRDILSRMSKKDQWLIQKRFREGISQQELADRLAISQSTLSRYEKKVRQLFIEAWNGP